MTRQSQADEGAESSGEASDTSFFSPWSNWRGWIVILVGIGVGYLVGFSPQLFILLAALCLACGWIFAR